MRKELKPIASKIYFIRGEQVMLDQDLAELYSVETKTLKRAVRRNINRFPEDFMFELTKEEWEDLRYQIGTSSQDVSKANWGGTRYAPFAFTEQGVAMLSGVLRSDRAAEVNIAIMRTFVHLRRWMEENKSLAAKIKALEKKYDEQFQIVFQAIQQLIKEEQKPRQTIGFKTGSKKD